MNPTRISRILRLISLLRSRKYYSINELAEKLEVSTRTVYRDLNVLLHANIPYFYDKYHGGYHILDTYFLPPVNFSFEEAFSLILLSKFNVPKVPFVELQKAIDKIESLIPTNIREELSVNEQGIEVRHPPIVYPEHYKDYYCQIHQAIKEKRVLFCKYFSIMDQKVIEFNLEPYCIFFAKRAWYVAGKCVLDGEESIRMFKLTRFRSVKFTDIRYKIPRKFSIDTMLGNAWELIRGDKSYNVKIIFDKKVADNIADTLWHKTQKIKRLPDGSIEFSVTVDGLDEIVWWVLGYGHYAKVVSPKKLKILLLEILNKARRQYEKHN